MAILRFLERAGYAKQNKGIFEISGSIRMLDI